MDARRGLRAFWLVPIGLLLAAACNPAEGSSHGNGRDPGIEESQPAVDPTGPADGSGSRTAGPRAGAQRNGESAGKVIKVLDSVTSLEGRRVASGDPFYPASELITDDRGRATFKVGRVLEDCQVQTDSRLTLAPSPRTPLEVEQGSVICRSKPGSKEFEVPAGRAIAQFLDPIFLIEVRGERTTVRVDYGFVQVRNSGNGAALLLGPGSQVAMGSGPAPERGSRFDASALGGDDAEARVRLRSGLPPEPSGFPEAGGSSVLRRAKAGGLRVGVEGRSSQQDQAFAGNISARFGESLGIPVNVDKAGAEEASAALAEGDLDMFLSPGAVPGAAGIPLFEDSDSKDWSMWVAPDERFQGILEQRLKSLLNSGSYGEAYYEVYGVVPTYEAVRSLAYPSPEEFDKTQWKEPTGPPASPEPPELPEEPIRSIALRVEPKEVLFNVSCPQTLTFVATVTVDVPGEYAYQWLTMDDPYKFDVLLAPKPGEYVVTEEREITGTRSGEIRFEIPAEDASSPAAPYQVTCIPTPP